MGDSNISSSRILGIKAQISLPKLGSSGLILMFVDTSMMSVLNYMVFIGSGNELFEVSLSDSFLELIVQIKYDISKYSKNEELIEKFKEHFHDYLQPDDIKSIVDKIKAGDVNFLIRHLKKAFKNLLAVDKAEVNTKYGFIKPGEYEEIRVEEEMDKLTMASRVKIAQKYSANKASVAEKIVRENIDDIALVKFIFSHSSGLHGCGVLLYSIFLRDFYRIYIAAGNNSGCSNIPIDMPISEFFKNVDSVANSESINQDIVSRIRGAFKSLNKEGIYNTIIKGERAKINEIIVKVLNNVVSEGSKVDLDLKWMNCIRVELLLNLGDRGKDAEEEVKQETGEFTGIKIVNVKPVLSPTRGVRLSNLQPGDPVHIIIESDNPLGQRIIDHMNLHQGEKIKPIGAFVHSVKFIGKEGFEIYFKITKGLYGKAVEEEDLKVKSGDPVIEEERKKSMASLSMGIAIGVIVLVLIVFILSMIFK